MHPVSSPLPSPQPILTPKKQILEAASGVNGLTVRAVLQKIGLEADVDDQSALHMAQDEPLDLEHLTFHFQNVAVPSFDSSLQPYVNGFYCHSDNIKIKLGHLKLQFNSQVRP